MTSIPLMTTLEPFLFLLTNHQTLPNCVDQTVKDAHLSITVTTIPPKVRGDVVNWTLIRILDSVRMRVLASFRASCMHKYVNQLGCLLSHFVISAHTVSYIAYII